MTERCRNRLAQRLDRAEASARRRHPVRGVRLALAAWRRPSVVRCEIFTGQRIEVVVPEIVGTALYRHKFIEPCLSRVMFEHLRAGMVVFDVGAQYGYHSLVASLLVGSAGTVVAFEPSEQTFRLLTRNVAGVTGVVTENVAVSDRPGRVALHDFGLGHSALNTVLGSARVPPEERRGLSARTYVVESTALDDYTATTGLVPDFVKLDAEGAELSILRGMEHVLRHHAPVLSLETGDYGDMDSPATEESIGFLENVGYRCLEYDGRLRPHVRRGRYDYGNLFFVKGGSEFRA